MNQPSGNPPARLHLFEGYGVELEYMIVDRETLEVLPISDRVLRELEAGQSNSGQSNSGQSQGGEPAAGEPGVAEPQANESADGAPGEVEVNGASWSNELVLHVIELKNTHPVPALEGLPELFQQRVRQLNQLLAGFGAMLLPSAMHPWMDPARDTRLWPHEYHEVYAAYDRIFDCRRHGWANLQSVHLNLPFGDDDQFARLHAAIRVLLPILPALAASSPFCEGRATGLMDTRMEVYRENARRVPSLTGLVIPEPIFHQEQYREQIFERMYADIAPLDPEGLLRHEFLNARGAIARFDRGAIEIRVLDVQECPLADVAVCAAVREILRELVAETWCDLRSQQAWEVAPLHAILLDCIRDADQAIVAQRAYLDLFAYPAGPPPTAGQLWRFLLDRACLGNEEFARCWGPSLETILTAGPLARRMLGCTDEQPTRASLVATCRSLADCLQAGVQREPVAGQV